MCIKNTQIFKNEDPFGLKYLKELIFQDWKLYRYTIDLILKHSKQIMSKLNTFLHY